MARRHTPLLGGLQASTFLQRYWQKKPLLIPNALPSFLPPVDKSLLIRLATAANVEARVVRERSKPRWRVDHGPFERSFFDSLPKSHWTLLVQDVDKHVEEARQLLNRFDFVPNWRVDDLMVSYATPFGSVGPHFDNYDVFLLQGRGRRRWSLSSRFDETALLDDTELRILSRFTAETEVVVEPGSMLYLPPGIAHHGVAEEESLTLSIGFRAPSQREICFPFVDELLARASDELRYVDPKLSVQRHRGLIDEMARKQLRKLLTGALAVGPLEMDRWLGRYLTEPKPQLAVEREGKRLRAQDLRRCRALTRALGSRWAYFVADATYLYADGEEYRLPRRLEAQVASLCDQLEIPKSAAEKIWQHPHGKQLLLGLTEKGLLKVET
jgi:50S ribosomal protein L16 3-hydroxylase